MTRFLSGAYCIGVYSATELYQILDYLADEDLKWISGYPADMPPFHLDIITFPITIFYHPRLKALTYNSLGGRDGKLMLRVYDFQVKTKPNPLDLSFLTE